MNFRDRYEFDPETYADDGGISAILRAAIQRYGANPASPADAEAAPGSVAAAQGGLLGRLLSLQAEQRQYRPVPESGAQPTSVAQNPNLNLTPLAPTVVQPTGTIGPSNLPNDQSMPAYSSFGDGATLDLLRTSQIQQRQYQPRAAVNAAPQREILAQSIMDVSQRLGIDPEDLATAISYETAGTFDPWKAGPVTQHGQHHGLIQWGEPQARLYGVTKDSSIPAQMEAVGKYLIDSGVTSRSKLLDIYSAINAGRVGRYGKTDANNGGAPGTVADKVAGMGDHRLKAARLLAQYAPSAFPKAPEKPVRVLSRRIADEPRSFDGDETPAQAWDIPSPMFNPRR